MSPTCRGAMTPFDVPPGSLCGSFLETLCVCVKKGMLVCGITGGTSVWLWN